MIRKILYALAIYVLWNVVLAQTMPDSFVVDVNPSSFEPNRAVDITLKAVTSNGAVVSDYVGDVFIEVEWSLSPDDYVLPEDGFTKFESENLGIKTFSKALTIKKPGTYTIVAYDILDDTTKGEKTIIVWQAAAGDSAGVQITSPVVNGIETNSSTTVLGSVPLLPNSPFQIIVNGQTLWQWVTSANGQISSIINGLSQWQNTLQIQITDGNGTIVGESDAIVFTYDPQTDDNFKWLTVQPTTTLQQWDTPVFVVDVGSQVTAVELQFSNGATSAQMDKSQEGKFTKKILMDKAGTIKVSVRVTAGWNQKLYNDVAVLTVTENIAIGQTRYFMDPVDKTALTLTWDVLWNASRFRVLYGTSSTSLDKSTDLATNEIKVTQINPLATYYFQITPLDLQNTPIGKSSDVIEVDPRSLISCVVTGIPLRTEKIDDTYYIIWDAVQYATKYVIYRSDAPTSVTSQMQKIAETTDTRFVYPYNTKAQNKEFAYYAVQAYCANGQEILIDSIKRVEVWPFDSIVLVIVLTLLVYSMYALYSKSQRF
jgi:hypothetical protein